MKRANLFTLKMPPSLVLLIADEADGAGNKGHAGNGNREWLAQACRRRHHAEGKGCARGVERGLITGYGVLSCFI